MNHIYLNSVITPKSSDEIKTLLLYYDKISIVNDRVYTPDYDKKQDKIIIREIQFLPPSFEGKYKMLIDEHILDIVQREDDEKDKDFDSKYASSISELINSKRDFLFPKKGEKIIVTDEIRDIVQYTFSEYKKIPLELTWWYYAFKLKWSIKLTLEGKTCVNSSYNLRCLFNDYIVSNTFQSSNNQHVDLVKKAIHLALPSVEMLSFEDILELKFRLKDELKEFTDTINYIEIQYKGLDMDKFTESEFEALFQKEIGKPYRELQQKIKSLRGKTFSTFIEKAKDVESYVPMIGFVIANIPLKLALMFSLGIISWETYNEYKSQKKEIVNSGFNYLIKLNTSI